MFDRYFRRSFKIFDAFFILLVHFLRLLVHYLDFFVFFWFFEIFNEFFDNYNQRQKTELEHQVFLAATSSIYFVKFTSMSLDSLKETSTNIAWVTNKLLGPAAQSRLSRVGDLALTFHPSHRSQCIRCFNRRLPVFPCEDFQNVVGFLETKKDCTCN